MRLAIFYFRVSSEFDSEEITDALAIKQQAEANELFLFRCFAAQLNGLSAPFDDEINWQELRFSADEE